MMSFSVPHDRPWRRSVAACLAVGALCAALPAAAQTKVGDVKLTTLTSLRPAGDDVTTPDGTIGWPGARYPSSPPLYAVRPGSSAGYLFGGFNGGGPSVLPSQMYTAFGMYTMRAGVSVYERVAYNPANDLHGRISGTPVRASDGSLYAVMTTINGERNAGKNKPSDISYSPAVGLGVIVRTDYDGANSALVQGTRGQLYSPNGALVIDAQDNLYGIDKGPKGQGRIFKLHIASGSVSTLHEFSVGPSGMRQTANDLILGKDGVLYGVTAYNRGLPLAPSTPIATTTPTGTLYRINAADGSGFAVLHTFTLAEGEINIHDNANSEGFVLYPSGIPYEAGVTAGGDVTNRTMGSGQEHSLSSLIDGGDGYLYGGTSVGDCYVHGNSSLTGTWIKSVTRDNPSCGSRKWAPSATLSYIKDLPYYDGPKPYGALYRIAKAGGPLQIVHTFSNADGATPRGPMALGADGAIYGTTMSGGGNLCVPSSAAANSEVGCGAVYRIRPASMVVNGDGQVTQSGFELVHSFSGKDGRKPVGVRTGSDGRLYGVTAMGGHYLNSAGLTVATDFGTVFQLAVDSAETPRADASLVASAGEIKAGETVSLTWITNNTKQCTAASTAGDWVGSVATQGSVELRPARGTYRYTLTCDVAGGAAGAQVSAAAVVYVSTPATAEDGNQVSYGNGGGGPLALWLLAPLAGLAVYRRRTQRCAARNSQTLG